MKPKFEYIYGPVYSWRLGMSLGIDPVTNHHKVCNFDCIYCQLGRTHRFETQRRDFVETDFILREIDTLPAEMDIDYFTFSGRGEPTLARNLGEMILALRARRQAKIAVITNSSLLDQKEVQADLLGADCVIAKLDACDQETLEKIDHTAADIRFDRIVEGIKSFKKKFQGKLAVQIMFMKENQKCARQIAEIARMIQADEVEINTPLRACAVKPLSAEELLGMKEYFTGLPVTCVYETARRRVEPLDEEGTRLRHGREKSGSTPDF